MASHRMVEVARPQRRGCLRRSGHRAMVSETRPIVQENGHTARSLTSRHCCRSWTHLRPRTSMTASAQAQDPNRTPRRWKGCAQRPLCGSTAHHRATISDLKLLVSRLMYTSRSRFLRAHPLRNKASRSSPDMGRTSVCAGQSWYEPPAGIEPATPSLPWIGGQAPCYPASSQVDRHREATVMCSVTSWSRSAQGSSPRPSTKGALFKPLTSWVWGLRCWWNPPVRFRAAGFGFFGEGVFGFVGEVVAEQDGEGLGEVPERHFGDTAADSAHRMADPGGHPQSTLGYGRSRASRSHPRGTRSMAGPCVSSRWQRRRRA